MPERPERPLPDHVIVIIVVLLGALALLPRCVPGVFPQSFFASSTASPRQGAKLAR
jgi:hypothetical protein